MADLSTISGLDHRYRADTITGVSDGGEVATWPDSSPNGYTATANSTSRFTLAASAIGGQPAVRMVPASTRYLASAASASLAASTTIAILTVSASGSGNRTVIGPSTGNALQRTVGSASKPELVAASAALIGTSTQVLTAGTAYVVTWAWDSTSGAYAFYVNGTLAGSGTQARALSAGATVRLGHSNGGEQFYGDLAEVAVWSKVLSAAERQTAHSYMQDRYGVTVSDYAPSGPTVTNTAAPVLSPTTGVVTGTVLSVTNGSWSVTPDSYTYQWTRAGAAISGATSVSYTTVTADVGNAIRCTVTAVKAGYTSGAANSNAVAPAAAGSTAPGAPTALTATSGDTQVALSWTAPSSNGGATITDYTVEYKTSAGSTWTPFTRAASTNTTATVTGLTNGTPYDFRVSAVNTIGTSTPSATASATPLPASALIGVTDANLVFSPANWDITSARAQTVNNGAYVRMAFAGSPTSIVANFDLSGTDTGSGKIEVRVDAEAAFIADLAATITIPIPTSNSWAKHLVEITVVQMIGNDLWNTPATTVKLTGFTVKPASVTTTVARRRPYRILALGDSITNGAFTGGAYLIDGRLNWAYPLRTYLGAEVGVVGFNSQGFSQAGGANVPVFESTYDKNFTGSPRSFAGLDAVVINHGANDGGTDNTAAMTRVLNAMLAANTTMKIVILQNWSGNGQKQYWLNAIAACSAPTRVTHVDTTGWYSNAGADGGLHPQGWVNLTELSPRAAATLSTILGGGATATPTYKRFINKAGVAVGIG